MSAGAVLLAVWFAVVAVLLIRQWRRGDLAALDEVEGYATSMTVLRRADREEENIDGQYACRPRPRRAG